MAEKVRLDYVEIMMELNEISKEYSELLVEASAAKIPILHYEGGYEKLTNLKKRLEALESPIEQLDSYFERIDANEFLSPLRSAVRSSLSYPLRHL